MMPDITRSKVWQVFQGIVYAMVVTLFVVWVAFGSRTVAAQNQDILAGIQSQIEVHQDEAAAHTCAIADELLFLSTHPAKVNGQEFKLVRPQSEIDALTELRNLACA